MLRPRLALVFGAMFVALLGTGASAQLVYSNGPINGTVNAVQISTFQSISDSFTVSSPASLTSVTAGIWNDSGDTTSATNWAIGTTPFGADVSSGAGSTTDVFQFTSSVGGNNFDIYEDSFAINGIVGPGTYWLTLSGALATGGDPTFWDLNNGPSVGYYNNGAGNLPLAGNLVPGSDSESFQIYGSQLTGTPEPGTYAMLVGLGVSALSVVRRRRRG